MASVAESSCPTCGEALGADAGYCFACGWVPNAPTSFTVQSAAPTAAEAVVPLVSQPTVDSSAAVGTIRCSDPGCGAELAASLLVCPYCSTTVAAAATTPMTTSPSASGTVLLVEVAGPWGRLPLREGDVLPLGRLPSFSPVHLALAPHELVGRRHATLALMGGRLVLRDQESRNGTFLNGVRLQSGAEVQLRDGDQISLAGEVSLEIGVVQT